MPSPRLSTARYADRLARAGAEAWRIGAAERGDACDGIARRSAPGLVTRGFRAAVVAVDAPRSARAC